MPASLQPEYTEMKHPENVYEVILHPACNQLRFSLGLRALGFRGAPSGDLWVALRHEFELAVLFAAIRQGREELSSYRSFDLKRPRVYKG